MNNAAVKLINSFSPLYRIGDDGLVEQWEIYVEGETVRTIWSYADGSVFREDTERHPVHALSVASHRWVRKQATEGWVGSPERARRGADPGAQ